MDYIYVSSDSASLQPTLKLHNSSLIPSISILLFCLIFSSSLVQLLYFMDSVPSHGYNNLTTSMEEDYNMEIIHLPEIDGALLMELLDDAPSTEECENERLNFVIRSFEAEIGSDSGLMVVGDGESTTGPNDMDSDDGGLESIDFDFDKYEESRPMMYDVGEDCTYAWKEMDLAGIGPTGHEWYVIGEDEDLAIGDQRGTYGSVYNFVGEHACMEQVYSPLWQ